jgi:hypothetical protein
MNMTMMKTTSRLMNQLAKASISLSLFSSIAILTACGGGGGTTKVNPPDTPPPVTTTLVAQEMKTRIAYGFTVQVTPYATSATAVPERLEVSVTDEAKVNGIPKAYFGSDFETGTQVTPSKTSTGWSIAVPASGTGGKSLLLSFTLANGDTFETGLTDFMF